MAFTHLGLARLQSRRAVCVIEAIDGPADLDRGCQGEGAGWDDRCVFGPERECCVLAAEAFIRMHSSMHTVSCTVCGHAPPTHAPALCKERRDRAVYRGRMDVVSGARSRYIACGNENSRRAAIEEEWSQK